MKPKPGTRYMGKERPLNRLRGLCELPRPRDSASPVNKYEVLEHDTSEVTHFPSTPMNGSTAKNPNIEWIARDNLRSNIGSVKILEETGQGGIPTRNG